MTEELPKGWVMTTLGEVCAMNPRPSPDELPSDETEVSFVPMAAVEEETGRMDTSQVRTLAAASKGYTPFKENDVVFAKITPCMENGKIALATGLRNGLGYGSTEFFVFRPFPGVIPSFVLHFLLQPSFRNDAQGKMTGGVGHKRVPSNYLFTHPFPLPPTREQERILAKLETILVRINKGEDAARRALDRLKRYRAAVLHAAITGKLTHEWRMTHHPKETGPQLLKRLLAERRTRWEEVELNRLQVGGKPIKDKHWKKLYPYPKRAEIGELPSLPVSWTWSSAEELTDATRPITYGVVKLGASVSGGVPTLRSSDVHRLNLDLNRVKTISRKVAEGYGRTFLRGGEVLVTVRGTLGGVAAVPIACAGYNISREVALLALLESKTSRSIAYFIASDLLQQWLNKRAKGVAYTGINIETLRQMPLPVPPLDELAEITREVERRLEKSDRIEAAIKQQLARAGELRQSLLSEAFSGSLVPQVSSEEPASDLLDRIRAFRLADHEAWKKAKKIRARSKPKREKEINQMTELAPSTDDLYSAWLKIEKEPDAQKLFETTGFSLDQVTYFYELLRPCSDIVEVFKAASTVSSKATKVSVSRSKAPKENPGRFRLVSLWLQNFKNLKDYEVRFGSTRGLDVVLGWNGTGKSNLFEALIIIFRDLHYWREENKWTVEPMDAYRLVYEIEDQLLEVKWNPAQAKRPAIAVSPVPKQVDVEPNFTPLKRDGLLLPKFVFGYYSGPTNRMADHFWPMKRDHYDALRTANSDDQKTLTRLLQQRRFFCAEASHAKYVLLAFSYKKDARIWKFLEDRLRIVKFESALFVIRKPRWAKARSKPEDFWGATGIMRRVMEKLKRYAVAPVVLKQKVADGYHLRNEEHYYFFLPDLKSLHEFAGEYADARSFFLALESTDFSELIYDVKIQVRVKGAGGKKVPITFRELSEGEQQLLMVLGLMRFTKSHQSLVLLDEPDTHLNPHWSVGYLKDLASVVSDGADPSPEQQTSQLLMATHDPLVIASLLKEQIHLLKRDQETLICRWEQASVNPRGLGFTGILTSEMFGFRSDLDPETLADLDSRVRLVAKEEPLSENERKELEAIDKRLAEAGFSKAFSDPYYAAFVRAWGRRYAEQMAGKVILTKKETEELERIAKEVLAEAVAEVEREVETDALH